MKKSLHGSAYSIDRIIRHLFALVAALSFVGYPLAGSLSALFSVDSTTTSYPFRGLTVTLSFLLIMLSLTRTLSSIKITFVVFLILYSARMLYDMYYSPLDLPDARFSGLFFLVTVLIPIVSLGISRAYYDEELLAKYILILSTISTVLIFALGLAGLNSTLDANGRLGFSSLDPVSVGYTALFSLISIYYLWKKSKRFTRLVIYMPVVTVALWVVLLTAARGVVISAFLCALSLSVKNKRAMYVLLGFSLIAFIGLQDWISSLPIADRFLNTGADSSSLERIDRISAAFTLMMQNKMFGYAYVDTYYFSFPHNLILESGMALGVFGATLMIWIQIYYFIVIRSSINNAQRYTAFLGIIGLSAAWLSSTLWSSAGFWVPLILLEAVRQWFSASRVQRQTRNNPALGIHKPPTGGVIVTKQSYS
jgi:hypothetical protein